MDRMLLLMRSFVLTRLIRGAAVFNRAVSGRRTLLSKELTCVVRFKAADCANR